MKKTLLFITLLGVYFTNFAQKAPRYYEINNRITEEKAGYKNTKSLTYFDIDNKEISKSKFNSKLSKYRFLQTPGDSLHHRKLVKRENHGQLKNYESFIRLLETELNLKINPNKTIVIVYYPGRNRCNAGGIATAKTRKKWFALMEAGIKKSNDVIYIYKDNEGMKNRYNISKWHKDPQGIMEQLFFPYHFPCSSFVAISKTGRYVSFYGEFGKPLVWKTVDFLRKSN